MVVLPLTLGRCLFPKRVVEGASRDTWSLSVATLWCRLHSVSRPPLTQGLIEIRSNNLTGRMLDAGSVGVSGYMKDACRRGQLVKCKVPHLQTRYFAGGPS